MFTFLYIDKKNFNILMFDKYVKFKCFYVYIILSKLCVYRFQNY